MVNLGLERLKRLRMQIVSGEPIDVQKEKNLMAVDLLIVGAIAVDGANEAWEAENLRMEGGVE